MTAQQAFMNWLLPYLVIGGMACAIGMVAGVAATIAVLTLRKGHLDYLAL